MQLQYLRLLRRPIGLAVGLLILGLVVEILLASLAITPSANAISSSNSQYAESCNTLLPVQATDQPTDTPPMPIRVQENDGLDHELERLLGSLAALGLGGFSLVFSYRLGLVGQAEQASAALGRRYVIIIVGFVIAASAFIGLLTKQHGLLGTGFAVFVDISILFIGITLHQQLLATGHVNLLSPRFLFIVAFGAYALATPYELLFNSSYVPFPAGASHLSQVFAMWLMVLALICVFVASMFGLRERIMRSRNDKLEEKPDDTLILWIAFITILAGLVGMYLFTRAFGGITGFFSQPSYVGRYTQIEGYGISLSLAWQFPLALLLIASTVRRLWSRRMLILIGWLGVYLIFTVTTGARREILIPLVGLVLLIHYMRFRIRARAIVALALVAFLALTIQGWVRNIDFHTNPRQAITCMLDSLSPRWFSPGSSEWSYQFNVLAYLVERVPQNIPYRMTYAEALIATLPQFVVHNRPFTPSVWITQITYPGYAAQGGGFAFSAVGEAYLNFGVPGVIVVFLIVGILVDILEGLSARPNLTFVICFGLTVVGGLLQFPRQDMVALLKIVIVIHLLPALIVMWLVFHSKALLSRIRFSASAQNVD